MDNLIALCFLMVTSSEMIDLMFAFLFLLVILLTGTLLFTMYKRKIDRNKKSWENDVAMVVSNAIFYTEEDGDFINSIQQDQKLLSNPAYRQYLINEIIIARKDLSGSSATNLKKLYETLELNKESLQKIKNKKWHIKARGVQELAIMEQKKYVKEIFRLTNDHNMFVRNEAQCGLLNFYGFLGLRFLNVTVHQISDWQQIQLLNKLTGGQPRDFAAIKKWLQSSNESVVAFAIKLATFYNRYELYEDVINCLPKANVVIKLCTLDYLKKHPRENTPSKLVEDYFFENKTYKLAILDALKDIGNEGQVTFLFKELYNEDHDIKMAAARALSVIHPAGSSYLKTYLYAHENPWKSIFLQIENDRAA